MANGYMEKKVYPAAAKKTGVSKFVFALILLPAMLLNWFIFKLLINQMNQELDHQFKQQANACFQEIESIFERYECDLHNVKSFYECSEVVSRREFKDFTRLMLETHPGLQAMCWIPAVGSPERQLYEEQARRQGLANYRFAPGLSNRFVTPVSECSVYYPIYYVEPFNGNEAFAGLNFASHPEWVSLLEKSAASGQPAVRIDMGLLSKPDELCVVLVNPVFHVKTEGEDGKQIQRTLQGFVAAVIFPQKDMSSLLYGPKEQISICVSHFQEDVKERRLFVGQEASIEPIKYLRREFTFADQVLLVEGMLLKHYFPASYRLLPWMLLLAGFAVGLALTFYVCFMQKQSRSTEQLVLDRTLELLQEQQKSRLLAEQAETANLTKSEFLAGMSHEIRTPMNAIVGFAEILTEENMTPVHRQYVKTIHESAQTLMTLINDILDLSKIEAGRMEIDWRECSLRELLGHIDALLRPEAERKEIGFGVQIDPEMPDSILIDPTRVRQCLMNLVNNVIQFTHDGHVTINVSSQPSKDRLWMRIDVEGSGNGIEEERRRIIFAAFSESRMSCRRLFGGIGLGLSITRWLAELMGGSLQLASTSEQQLVFTLLLPLEPVCKPVEAVC